MKTILVTGGAGFIGSHLCESLVKEGHYVICLDNLFTGSKDNIKHLMEKENFEFFEHDIIDPIFVDKHIDQIYNLACPASPPHYQKNAIRTIKANTIGMINVLGLAKKHKARILQASTSEVYGNPLEHPQPETYWGNVNCIGPRSCYDEGKRCAEALMFDYHRSHGVDIAIIRIFNTYGPNMDPGDGRVVSNFIMQALQDKPITVYGDGKQTRSFCFVSDLVEGMKKVMGRDGFKGPVNLGNPEEFTILELAELVIGLTGSRSKIIFEDLPEDDPVRRKPDISFAKVSLKWEPKVHIKEGLKHTIDYFKKIAETPG